MDGLIRVSVCFFAHDGKGNYLVLKRSQSCRDEKGTWEPGGGGLKFGEKVEDCLRRELCEELCTEPLETEFLGYRDVHRKQDGVETHWVALDFRVKVDPKAVKIGEPNKCDEIRWVVISDIPKPMHSQFPLYLELRKKQLT